MRGAMAVINSNHWKYTQNFYQHLPFGTNIYLAEDGELFIDPKGDGAPDEFIIKRKPNPDYYTTKIKSSRGSHAQEDEMSSSIEEEDLSK